MTCDKSVCTEYWRPFCCCPLALPPLLPLLLLLLLVVVLLPLLPLLLLLLMLPPPPLVLPLPLLEALRFFVVVMVAAVGIVWGGVVVGFVLEERFEEGEADRPFLLSLLSLLLL